jgi:hypothetical protein
MVHSPAFVLLGVNGQFGGQILVGQTDFKTTVHHLLPSLWNLAHFLRWIRIVEIVFGVIEL